MRIAAYAFFKFEVRAGYVCSVKNIGYIGQGILVKSWKEGKEEGRVDGEDGGRESQDTKEGGREREQGGWGKGGAKLFASRGR